MPRTSLPSHIARAMANSANRKRSGGRLGGQRKRNAPRCPCEAMTLKRALSRGKSAEHEAECSFYRERGGLEPVDSRDSLTRNKP
jgi:hypothetical protein